MANKPSYEELEQRVKKLENEVLLYTSLEEELESIYNFSLDMIGLGNLEGYFTKVNSSFEQILGYTEEEFLKKPFLFFVHQEDFEKTEKALNDAAKGKEIFFIENRYRCKDGSYKWIEWKGHPLFEENKFIAVGREITERKQTEGALRKAHDKLEERVKERTAVLTKLNERLNIEIDERKNMEEALRDSEKHYRLLAENVSDVIWTLDMNMNISYLSPSVKKLTGFSVEEAMIHTWEDIFTHDSLSVARSTFEKAVEEAKAGNQEEPYKSYVLELEMNCKDGSTVWTEIHGTFLRNSDGQPSGVIGITRNISERKRMEEQLRESEEKYRLITETAEEGIYQTDISGKIVFTNKAHTRMLGYKPGEMVGTHYTIAIPDKILKKAAEIVETVLSGKPQKGEFTMKHKLGHDFPVYYSLVPTKKQGKIIGLTGILRDITDLKQTENLIRNLTHRLLESQEDERQMISRELHDTVAQDISSLRINCEMLLKYKSLKPGIRKKISEVSESLKQVLKSVRDLSYYLRPPGLEKIGLVQTMYQHCKDFSDKTGILIDFQSAGIDNLNLDHNTKINLYRLLQEGLNNVKKHADATNVQIRLVSSFPNIILRINDDGKGFDLKERLARTSSEKRMGLRSMEERVSLVKGKINIESGPGKGTKVVIEIPHKKDENIGT